MPYFKYRIKETTTADVAIWGENEQDAMDKLDLYWIDNSCTVTLIRNNELHNKHIIT